MPLKRNAVDRAGKMPAKKKAAGVYEIGIRTEDRSEASITFERGAEVALVKQNVVDAIRSMGVHVRTDGSFTMRIFGESKDSNLKAVMEAAKRAGSIDIEIQNKLLDPCIGFRIPDCFPSELIPCDRGVRPPQEEEDNAGDPPTFKEAFAYDSGSAIF